MTDDTSRGSARPDPAEGMASPLGEMKTVDKASPEGHAAVSEFNATVGYDIRTVMNDDWWKVAVVEGDPIVVLAVAGVRALARFAPRPDASEVAEQIINQVRGMR